MKKFLLFFVFMIFGCTQSLEIRKKYTNEQGFAYSARLSRMEHEPRVGENFGLPKDQARREIGSEIRNFLDGILDIYKQPKLIGSRKSVLNALELRVLRRTYFATEGQLRPTFREDLLVGGGLSPLGWGGDLYYDGVDQAQRSWSIRIVLKHNEKIKTCINSRAVEGYMDEVVWRPSFSLTAHQPYWPSEYWDRHGDFGGIWAFPLDSTSPGLSLSFVEGCLVEINIAGTFYLGEMTDDEFYN